MKITVKTSLLQQMVAKVVKGASNNKMIPITSLMAIEQKDGVLTLTTTDSTNTFKVFNKLPEQEEFYVVVPVDIFSKLVARTTTENITLTLNDDSLEMCGNGKYNIDLQLDEVGNLIRFPEPKFDASGDEVTIKSVDVKKILTTNKAALATTLEIPCITGYYCGKDEVITTDTFKVCHNPVSLFSEPALLPPELLDLLALADEEVIKVSRNGSRIMFHTPTMSVYGVELEDIEEYPIEAIGQFLDVHFTSVCTVNRTALLDVLNRLSLFVAPYDNNSLRLTFNNDSLMISSKKSNGTEAIKYETSKNFTPFTCCIDIALFASQVAAQTTDTVELWYGHDTAVKMVSEGVTQIIALVGEDNNG
jgi:DNA polymerase III sliding clamp (beta) subunit (PCNA family)